MARGDRGQGGRAAEPCFVRSPVIRPRLLAKMDAVRNCCHMIFTSGKVFNVLGIIFGLLIVLYGVVTLLASHFHAIVIGMWLIFFGLVEIMSELRYIQMIHIWFRFMTVFVGKAFFFLFIGTIIMGENTWHHVMVGVFMLVLAIMYAIAHFVYHTSETTHLLGNERPMENTASAPA